ncbi:MAG: heparan-alpha-glucosaminide N-acetyltransferase domain-containing protein [Ruthenibacterium sp.]
MEKPLSKTRIALFDIAKTIALVNMIAFHTLYDIVFIFGVSMPWFTSQGAFLWQQAICWTFILVSGAVFPYSRNPFSHGIILLWAGLLLTAVTFWVMPSERILFGILHCLGCAALISAFAYPLLRRVPPVLGTAVSFFAFLLTYSMPQGTLSLFGKTLVTLPAAWAQIPFLFPLGIVGADFFSSDYFPLFPWLFLYWTGLFLWRACEPKFGDTLRKMPQSRACKFIARHSLLIYLLHQPIVYGVLYLIFT